MATLSSADAAAHLPVLPRETVAVPALGGDVIVRDLRLSERLSLFSNLRQDGRNYESIGRLLSLCVIDAAGTPLLSEDQWEELGGGHFDQVFDLFKVARKLSGLDAEAVEKN